MIRGAIFDVDGTILDSMEIWEDAGERYLKGMGIQPEEGLSEIFYPMTVPEAAEYMRERYALTADIPEIIDGIAGTVRDYYYYEAPLKEGARELLESLRRRGIAVTAATSSERDHIEAAFRRLGIDGYFDRIFTCTEVGAGKRNPLIYLRAAEYMRAKPEETYVFEDALYALATAKRAGFHTVGVYDSSRAEDQEQIRNTAEIYLRRLMEGVGEK